MTNAFKPDTSVGFRHEMIPPDEPECPYLERWILGVGVPGHTSLFSLRLHHFFRSDEDHLHDHPGWFVTLVLRGSYEDWVECKWCKDAEHPIWCESNYTSTESPYSSKPCNCGLGWDCGFCYGSRQVVGTKMKPGTIRYRPALHRHRVVTDGCWTLVLFGPRKRDWGFWVNGKWMKQRRYFERYGGAAACREVDQQEEKV